MKNSLRRIYILLLFIALFGTRALAQQDAQYSHYMFNGFVFNPAIAGNKESLSALGLFRTQFVGIDGGPQTQSISAHMPIANISSGIGLHIVNDRIGAGNNTLNFMASYAYRYQMASGILSGGLALGFIQRTLDGSKLTTNDPNDPLVPTGTLNAVKPDINIGAMYNTEQYYVGLSATHLNMANMGFDGIASSEYKNVIHTNLMAGYNWNVNPSIDIKPSVLLRYSTAFTFDVSAMAFFNQKYWGGLSYRLDDAIIGIVGLNITPSIKFSYAYDYTLSDLNIGSNGSHEVILGYDVVIKKKIRPDIIIKTPRFL
jgi:type IX secretion system PorP/SprF family membrane protein